MLICCFSISIGISFLPLAADVYPQMPYEEISEEAYHQMAARLTPPDFRRLSAHPEEAYPEKFCDSSTCAVDHTPPPNTV